MKIEWAIAISIAWIIIVLLFIQHPVRGKKKKKQQESGDWQVIYKKQEGEKQQETSQPKKKDDEKKNDLLNEIKNIIDISTKEEEF